MEYIARIEPRILEYFSTRPDAPYGVKRLDLAQEASMTFGYYQQPTPAESVGYYRYNGSKLEDRSLRYVMDTPGAFRGYIFGRDRRRARHVPLDHAHVRAGKPPVEAGRTRSYGRMTGVDGVPASAPVFVTTV